MGVQIHDCKQGVTSIFLTPTSVNPFLSVEQTFTLPGATTDMMLSAVNKPTAQAGLGIVGLRIPAANQIAITYMNDTIGAITPTAESYRIHWIRPEIPANSTPVINI